MNKSTPASRKPKVTAPATPRPRKVTGAAAQAQQDKIKATKARTNEARVERLSSVIQFVSMVGIATIAFVASYQELRDLCIIAGKSAEHLWSTANLIPIGLDLMLVIGSLRLRRKGITRTARIIARIGSVGGLLLSLAGNVIHGWWHNVSPETSANYLLVLTLVVSAVPVASLLASTEMLTHTHKDVSITKRAKVSAPVAAPAPVVPQAIPVHVTPASWQNTVMGNLRALVDPMGRKA